MASKSKQKLKLLGHVAYPRANTIVNTQKMIDAFRTNGAKVTFVKGDLTITFQDKEAKLYMVGKEINVGDLRNVSGQSVDTIACAVLSAH